MTQVLLLPTSTSRGSSLSVITLLDAFVTIGFYDPNTAGVDFHVEPEILDVDENMALVSIIP